MNKKKAPALLAVCAILCCSAFSCGGKDSSKAPESSSVSEETTAEPTTEPATEPATDAYGNAIPAETFKNVEETAITYMNAAYSGEPEAAFAVAFPEEIAEEIKKLDVYKEFAEEMQADASSPDDEPPAYSIANLRKFDDEQIKAAEEYYNAYARSFNLDREYRVTEGYYFDLTADFGVDRDSRSDMKAVYVANEGWKILKTD